ncbi:MAG: ATP-dependent DNA helicase, partial [Gammaproteobacteria bacterium]|nr:ATP-dependent DNA helicase [Gammaproteobacteria bacterium]
MREHNTAALLDQNGPLAQAIEGFRARPQQIAMAQAVELAIDKKQNLIVEAGTGTGKTFAYLLPALISGRKIIVSTGTRNLQDQLFLRDIPLLLTHLSLDTRIALLKGRSNYLCLHRMHKQLESGRFRDRDQIHQLHEIRDWSTRSKSGDIAELSDIAENSPIWPAVTSTTDNCLGTDCEYIDRCHVLAARGEAQSADLVVVNHHLFCADMALKKEGINDLLPDCDAIVFDEAHQL